MRKKFLSDTVFYTAALLLLRMRGLIVLPLFARLIGTEGYGIFTQLNVTVAFFVPFISLRLETAAVRFLSAESDAARFRKRFYSAFLLIALVGLIAAVLLNLFSHVGSQLIFNDDRYGNFMVVGGLLLFTSVISTYLLNYFRTTHRIKMQSVLLLAQSTLETVAILLAVYLGFGITGAFWALAAVQLLFSIGFLSIIASQIGWFSFERHSLREMLEYSLPLMPNSLMSWIVNYADRLVIIHFLGLAAVGVYSASYSLGSTLSLLKIPVSFVLFPFLSRVWDKGERDEARRYFTFVTRYYILLALPACAGLALVSQNLIRFLASPDFVTDSLLVLWIALGVALNGLFQINIYVFHLLHETKYVSFIFFVSAILNVVLNLLLVPVVGISGSAVATAATFLLMAVVAIIYGRRAIGYRLDWRSVGKSALASMIMIASLYWLSVSSLVGILGVVLLGVIVYFALLLIFRTFTKSEMLRAHRLLSFYSISIAKVVSRRNSS